MLLKEEGIFERLGIWEKLEEIKKKIYFDNGSYLILNKQALFVPIDVNSGKNLNQLKKNKFAMHAMKFVE